MTLRKKYRFITRLVPASSLAVALLVAVGVPVVAESAPSVSLSSQNIQSGQSSTATVIFVSGPADPTADPPVHAVISVVANHGTGNAGRIALTVVSATPNLIGCVLAPVFLLGEQVTCDWSGPPVAGDTAQIVVTITTSDDAVGVWLVNSYIETKSGGTDSSSGTQFQVTKPPPTTTNPPPIVDAAVEVVPNFAG